VTWRTVLDALKPRQSHKGTEPYLIIGAMAEVSESGRHDDRLG